MNAADPSSSLPSLSLGLEPLTFTSNRAICICDGPASASGYYCSVECARVAFEMVEVGCYPHRAAPESPVLVVEEGEFEGEMDRDDILRARETESRMEVESGKGGEVIPLPKSARMRTRKRLAKMSLGILVSRRGPLHILANRMRGRSRQRQRGGQRGNETWWRRVASRRVQGWVPVVSIRMRFGWRKGREGKS